MPVGGSLLGAYFPEKMSAEPFDFGMIVGVPGFAADPQDSISAAKLPGGTFRDAGADSRDRPRGRFWTRRRD